MEMTLPDLVGHVLSEFVSQPFIHDEMPTIEVNIPAGLSSISHLNSVLSGTLRPLELFKGNLQSRIDGLRILVIGGEDIEKAVAQFDKEQGLDRYFHGDGMAKYTFIYEHMNEQLELAKKQVNLPDQTGDLALHHFIKTILLARIYNWLRVHPDKGIKQFTRGEAVELGLVGWGPIATFGTNAVLPNFIQDKLKNLWR